MLEQFDPPPQLFIALYGGPSKQLIELHWGLILTEGDYPFLSDDTTVIYQVIDTGSNATGIERWRTDHRMLTLESSSTFLGVVKLPEMQDCTFEDVKDVLDTIPAFPRDLTEEWREQWNCAMWVLDILLQYGKEVWGMDFKGADGTYEKLWGAILARASHLQRSLQDNPDVFVADDGLRVVQFSV